MQKKAAVKGEDDATIFERFLIKDLVENHGFKVTPNMGSNALWWEIKKNGKRIEMVMVSKLKNGSAAPPTGDVQWLLRVREKGPLVLTKYFRKYFKDGKGITRNMKSFGHRTQFKSTNFIGYENFTKNNQQINVYGKENKESYLKTYFKKLFPKKKRPLTIYIFSITLLGLLKSYA